MTTLRERRIRGDLIEAFKTLRGINKVEKNDWFDVRSSDVSRPTRGNTTVINGAEVKKIKTLYKKPAKNEIRNNFSYSESYKVLERTAGRGERRDNRKCV